MAWRTAFTRALGNTKMSSGKAWWKISHAAGWQCFISAASKEKFRVVLDLPFGAGGPDHGRLGVNVDADFDKAPISEINGVVQNVIGHACALGQAVENHVPMYGAKWTSRMRTAEFISSGIRHRFLLTS